MPDLARVEQWYREVTHHLEQELLPFWIPRMIDRKNGGFITHFDERGEDSGVDEKSLIAQSRLLYVMSAVARSDFAGWRAVGSDGGATSVSGTRSTDTALELARHGYAFLRDRMWDRQHGGFYWMANRRGEITVDRKIVYGQSFGIYALSEYFLASGDRSALEHAEAIFDLLQKYALDSMYGGYFEMFDRNWDLAGPGSAGGDRKTLDVHMHLMEAYTNLLEASGESIHRRKLLETIELLSARILHPKYRTGISQFFPDWSVAPQIKFDIVWGWDRYAAGGAKPHSTDTTSYGHNVEFAWLLSHAMSLLGTDRPDLRETMRLQLDHCVRDGIDTEHGGVYVEGAHAGGVYDREKEFWQQAEVLIGMLEGYLLFRDERYLGAFEAVWRFLQAKGINHDQGEWWPLLTREGEPIWRHMSHSWKINYHTVRSMIESAKRLKMILAAAERRP